MRLPKSLLNQGYEEEVKTHYPIVLSLRQQLSVYFSAINCWCQSRKERNQTRKLKRLLDKGSGAIENSLNIEKVLKGLKSLKIQMNQHFNPTPESKYLQAHHEKNLIALDSSENEARP